MHDLHFASPHHNIFPPPTLFFLGVRGRMRRISKNWAVHGELSVSLGGFKDRIEHLVYILFFFAKKTQNPNNRTACTTYILLTIDNYVCQKSYIHTYFQFMNINSMVIIMNNLHYIYEYEKLKYGLFIGSLITATSY